LSKPEHPIRGVNSLFDGLDIGEPSAICKRHRAAITCRGGVCSDLDTIPRACLVHLGSATLIGSGRAKVPWLNPRPRGVQLIYATDANAGQLSVTSYDEPDGYGTASGGSSNYWDAGYSGSGCTNCDGAPLSGGIGALTRCRNLIPLHCWEQGCLVLLAVLP